MMGFEGLDRTRWMDEFQHLGYYDLKEMDSVVIKVRLVSINNPMAMHVFYIENDEKTLFIHNLGYDYMVTVEEYIESICKQLQLGDSIGLRLWLPLSMTDLSIGIWLDPERFVSSYSLYDDLLIDSDQREAIKNLRTAFLLPSEDVKWLVREHLDFFVVTEKEEEWCKRLMEGIMQMREKKMHKFQNYVRVGLPAILRGDIWMILSGSHDLVAQNPNIYNIFIKETLKLTIQEEIRKDLKRTLPQHPFFDSNIGLDKLERVLHAFAVKNPEIGYCQSLNYLAAILLLNMPEEHAFWTLDTILYKYGLSEMYTLPDLPLLQSAVDQLGECIVQILPEVAEHLELIGMSVDLFAVAWIHTMFARNCILKFTNRIWDTFFNEGPTVIFRFCLAIIREGQDFILQNDIMQILDFLRNATNQITDVDLFANVAFQKIPDVAIVADMYSARQLRELRSSKRKLKAKTTITQYDPLRKVNKSGKHRSGPKPKLSIRDFVIVGDLEEVIEPVEENEMLESQPIAMPETETPPRKIVLSKSAGDIHKGVISRNAPPYSFGSNVTRNTEKSEIVISQSRIVSSDPVVAESVIEDITLFYLAEPSEETEENNDEVSPELPSFEQGSQEVDSSGEPSEESPEPYFGVVLDNQMPRRSFLKQPYKN